MEVLVEGEQLRAGLERVRGDPDIVRRDRPAPSTQRRRDSAEAVRSPEGDGQEIDVRVVQKRMQPAHVLLEPGARTEAEHELARHDRGKENSFRPADALGYAIVPPH